MKKPRATRSVPDGRSSLRLWLRLLACTNLIESRVRAKLRDEFSTTLPRFDMLAQLDAASSEFPKGLTMGELSRRLMVTNGNITGLTGRLVQEGLVTRVASATDRRQQRVALTSSGKRSLAAMASAHRSWVQKMFSCITQGQAIHLYKLTGRLKESVQSSERRRKK